MNPRNFFSELKRRNVYKVAVAYAVVGWVIAQVATQIFPFLEIPNWIVRLVIMLIAIGFPIALVIAWAFEATPEGIKRTEDADRQGPSPSRSRTWIYVAGLGAAVSVGLFFIGRYTAEKNGPVASAEFSAKSIAVLPFDNLSRDPDNAFFTEGVQDEILTRLAKVADLKVISRTSTQRFKSAPDNLPQIAKQLGVMHILEGSVQKSSDQVRVNVQLINAMTDAHLWAEIYDRKLTDIFSVESDIAKTIADTLQAKLTGSERQMMTAQPTTDTTAYELYHKGRSLWGHRSGDNIPRAISFYEQAIAHDPNYAPAYAGLASAYVILPFYTKVARAEPFQKAKEAALKALSLDPNLAEAHAALGKLHYFTIDLAGSLREYERAIQLEPNYATAHQWYGNDSLVSFARFDQAIGEGRRAVELDPQSAVINADLGITLYLARRYDESIAQFHKTLAIDPAFFYAHYNLGVVLQLKGDLLGAIAEYERARQLSDDDSFTLALLGAAKGLAGDKSTAQQILQDLSPGGRYREVDDYSRALVYLGLNNKEEALRALERTFAAGDGSSLCWIKVDPMLDPLRGDPRFEALVQKVVAEKK
jgi:TolB-like protein/tetratricopeptide (TPR) repeat protein